MPEEYIPPYDRPGMINVLERNIHTIIHLRTQADLARPWYSRLADAITEYTGRISFLVINILFFAAWLIINSGHLGITPFDPFPYNMLTTVVSLEAIVLSIFVLITQRRSEAQAERHADLALQIGLLSEYELTRVIQMLDAIQDRMDIDNNEDETLVQLETELHPEDVLEEIDRVRSQAYRNASRRTARP
ncbi:MAG: DUF1003 domain-containing protein [Chloroflexi bacterium]|nr:DUF1003 domain-containing protein [Chloroflexota bacterium]